MEGERAALEGIPRDSSYVYAPADPLLISYARSWSRSEPYLLRSVAASGPDGAAVAGSIGGGTLPLRALADGAGAVIRMGGPELPLFLNRRAAGGS
jgi:hypothetical protein